MFPLGSPFERGASNFLIVEFCRACWKWYDSVSSLQTYEFRQRNPVKLRSCRATVKSPLGE